MPKTAAWAATGSSCKQGVDGSNPSSGFGFAAYSARWRPMGRSPTARTSST